MDQAAVEAIGGAIVFIVLLGAYVLLRRGIRTAVERRVGDDAGTRGPGGAGPGRG